MHDFLSNADLFLGDTIVLALFCFFKFDPTEVHKC